MSKWKVSTQGDANSGRWEISVLLESNLQGQKSWGWWGEDKFIISSFYPAWGPCHRSIRKTLWEREMAIAQEVCDGLNEKALEADPRL